MKGSVYEGKYLRCTQEKLLRNQMDILGMNYEGPCNFDLSVVKFHTDKEINIVLDSVEQYVNLRCYLRNGLVKESDRRSDYIEMATANKDFLRNFRY